MSGGAADAQREAKRVLKATAHPLRMTFEGAEARLSGDGRALRVSARTVRALLGSGALRRDGATVVRTLAGEAALRRLLSEPGASGDAPHAAQHRALRAGTVERDGASEPVMRNAAESPLARLATAREKDGSAFLHPELAEAGWRLLSDFERAQLRQRVTARWEMGASTGSTARGPEANGVAASAAAARGRYERAVAALGPRLGPALVDLVCHEFGLADIERSRAWPARSGKMMLREALDRLAAHYRGERVGSRSPDRAAVGPSPVRPSPARVPPRP